MSKLSVREAGLRRRDPKKEAFWREALSRQRHGGLGVPAFCEAEGLKATAFYFWRREIHRRDARQRRQVKNDPGTAPAFVELRPAGAASLPSGRPEDLYAARLERRREQSLPALAKIKVWLDEQQIRVLPKSPVGQAIAYALKLWPALTVYATDGRLSIDNNVSERALRRVAVGRKNWLFAGSDAGGRTAAVLYTFVASAERHGLDPEAYLRGMLARLPSTPLGQVAQFLPDRWNARLHAEESPTPD